jgi:hypothetical protein
VGASAAGWRKKATGASTCTHPAQLDDAVGRRDRLAAMPPRSPGELELTRKPRRIGRQHAHTRSISGVTFGAAGDSKATSSERPADVTSASRVVMIPGRLSIRA